MLEMGDARLRPDRRAGGDRRARRRRDHQHRPGPPRAGGLAGGRRAGEGRAARRARRRHRGRARPASRCSSRSCATTSRSSRFGPAATSMLEDVEPAARRRSVGARAAGRARAAVHRAPPAGNPLAAVAAARAVGVQPSGRVDVRFGALRGERVALPTRRRRHQRLLQRQPAVHACRPRRSRHARRRRAAASPCSETCSSSAPPSASTTARSAPTRPSAGRRRCSSTVGPRAAAMLDVVRRRVARGRRRRGGGRAGRASSSRPGDVVLVKASRGVGLEVVAEALQAAG